MTHVRWFGKSWQAPICEEQYHMPVPVGTICCECLDPIEEQDSGIITGATGGVRGAWAPLVMHEVVVSHHRECFMGSILGSDRERADAPQP